MIVPSTGVSQSLANIVPEMNNLTPGSSGEAKTVLEGESGM
jgi:hypothetical protein